MTAPNIQTLHAFTTRFGGVSGGIYASLNLGVNTFGDREHVRENYAIIRKALDIPAGRFTCTNQVHGSDILSVTRADCGEPPVPPPYGADGLITRDPSVALTVYAADCVPILLYDPVQSAIGALHAGWRGTAADIAGEAVRKMALEFGCAPVDVRAAIGPCISECCYETGRDVADAITGMLGTAAGRCIAPKSGNMKFMVDLKEANRLLLKRAGVRDITISDECTSCRCDKYWSHRKTNGLHGSHAALIMLL